MASLPVIEYLDVLENTLPRFIPGLVLFQVYQFLIEYVKVVLHLASWRSSFPCGSCCNVFCYPPAVFDIRHWRTENHDPSDEACWC